MIGKKILLFLSLACTAALAGCGGPNNLTLQNPPAPATKSASIAFSPTPVTSISLAASATLTAVVSNDPTNAGVDWALLCQAAGNCGTLTALHTASGSPTTYKPPQSISGNSQTVTIQAFATANQNSNATTSVTVTGFAGNLKGKYVFETNGIDANGIYQLVGVVVLDGNGNVTSGEQTHNDPLISVSDPITGGSYYIGQDGRGTLTINTADQNIGQLGIENLALEIISNSQALIATFDDANLPQSFETSLGTLDLQTSGAAPTGGYAFVMSGVDISSATMGMGGVFNIDSPNAISGAGSVADQDDSYTGVVTEGSTLSGTLTTPDSFGSLKFNLTTGFAPSMQFTGYIVDSTHIKLIESDNAGSGSGFGTTAGVAIGQGAARGTFTNNGAFAGSYVFNIEGEDQSQFPLSLASYGQFTADSSGNLNAGYNDEVGSNWGVFISDSFTGIYTLDASGTGRVDSTINYSISGPGPELIFYLTGNGNPSLVLDADDNSNSLFFGSIGMGFVHPQASPPFLFSGRYGLEFADANNSGTLNTATGQSTANNGTRTFSGVIDTNYTFAPQPDTVINGTFGSIPSTGRFTGTLYNSLFPSPTNVPSTISVAYYPVDDDLIFFIETDYAVSFESTFGYFTTRTPVCSVCP